MVRGIIGRGGSGKSLLVCSRLHKKFLEGRDIISNTPLIDLRVERYLNGRFRWAWRPVDPVMFGHSWAVGYVKTFDDVLQLDNCEVLIDECSSWCPASQWKDLPEDFRRFLSQDRREGVNLWWTDRAFRVDIQLRENTAELVRNVRYGPVVVSEVSDPQDKADKPVYRFMKVSSYNYDLYDTMARVGSAKTGDGYGIGKRHQYRVKEAPKHHWVAQLPTVNGRDYIYAKVALRPEQVDCLIRKFGPESVGLYREVNRAGAIRYVRGPEASIHLCKLADDPEIRRMLYGRGLAADRIDRRDDGPGAAGVLARVR